MGYDVSAVDARVDASAGLQTKGDSRTLPHAGQRAGSAGSMLLALDCNANFGSSSRRA